MGNYSSCRDSWTEFDINAPIKLDRTKGGGKLESKSESSSSRRSCDVMAWAVNRELPLPYGVDVNGCGFSIDLGDHPSLLDRVVKEPPSLEGEWCYNGPGNGRHKFELVVGDESHIIFREYHDDLAKFAEGSLQLNGDWYEGDLRVGNTRFGTIRVKLDEKGDVIEQFKKKPYHEWGSRTMAFRETQPKHIGRSDLQTFKRDVWSHLLTGELLTAITGALGKQRTMYCHHFSSHQYAVEREGDPRSVFGVTAAGKQKFSSAREVWNFLRKPRCCGVLAYDSRRGRMVCGPSSTPNCCSTACDDTTCLFIANGLACPVQEFELNALTQRCS